MGFNFKQMSENRGFELLPEDRYTVNVENAIVDNNQMKITLQIISGIDTGTKYAKRKGWLTINLTSDFTGDILYNLIYALQIKELLDTDKVFSFTEIANMIIGKQCSMFYEHSTKDGKTYGNFKKFQPVTTVTATSATTTNDAKLWK